MPSNTERRKTEQLLNYWTKVQGNRKYPAESDINPKDIKEIWDNCFLIQVTSLQKETKAHCNYTYLGSSIIKAYGDDLTGHDVFESLISTQNPELKGYYQTVLNTGKPLIKDSSFTNTKGVTILFRECLLPLGSEDHTIDYIIGCMTWRTA